MRNTLSGRLEAWGVLHGNLKPQITESPHLADDLANLERLMQEGQALEESRKEHLRAISARGRERKMVVAEGDAVFRKLTLGLRAQFGPKSEKLFKYGVTPERPRRRRLVVVEPEETSEPESEPAAS